MSCGEPPDCNNCSYRNTSENKNDLTKWSLDNTMYAKHLRSYLILCNKSIAISDIVESLGIKASSIWFEYIFMKFANNYNCDKIESFEQLNKTLCDRFGLSERLTKIDIISKLNNFNINGDYFVGNNIYIFDSIEFKNVNFDNIKLRKIKFISFNRLLE
jgi:hypothetical protein